MDKRIEYLLVSNRGPDFISNNIEHKSAGGTQTAYIELMKNYCSKWFCLADKKYFSDNIISVFGNKLQPIFIQSDIYNDYYYKFISEYLYPSLLGCNEKAIHIDKFNSFEIVSTILSKKINVENPKKVILCDYHLWQLPNNIDNHIYKIFFWFIPFLDVNNHSEMHKSIVYSLSKCHKLIFLTHLDVLNFIQSFKFYFPDELLLTKVLSSTLGPDNFFKIIDQSKSSFDILLKSKFNIENNNNNFILSVSRLDYVKNIPVLIKGFDKYLENSCDTTSILLIIAPYHRKNSKIYRMEENLINKLISNSKYNNRVLLTHNNFSRNDLKVIYNHCNTFVCSSLFDGMPLTPLEYALSNSKTGKIILSNSIGAYNLLEPFCFSFESNNYKSLSLALLECKNTKTSEAEHRMKNIILKIKRITLNKWLTKIQKLLN